MIHSTRERRIAVVLWTGGVGGAEMAALTLARFLRAENIAVAAVFVGDTGAVGERFRLEGFAVSSINATPGSRVLLAPLRAARVVRDAGPDGAILSSGGILALALRLGGYAAPLIAVENGSLAQLDHLTFPRQLRTLANWSSGVRVVDVYVGVSQFIADTVRRHAPGCRAVHIPNGIDTEEFAPLEDRTPDLGGTRPLILGCAGRFIPGKGFEDAIDAAARVAKRMRVHLRLAGDGPLRGSLAGRVPSNGGFTIEFAGWCSSMPDFWRACDIAIVPTSGLLEAFGMTALEAMACGVPVIASNSGGLPEVVSHDESGAIYPAGDIDALDSIISRLAADAPRRRALGLAARRRVVQTFDATLVARSYLGLLQELHSRA